MPEYENNFNQDENLLKEEGIQEEKNIEDAPEPIDLRRFVFHFFKEWKVLLLLMTVCGLGWGILHPGSSSTTYGASCTLYIPPYVTKEIGGQKFTMGNNISQIPNALGLIQSKVYRDIIAQELGVDSISGTYSVSRQQDTEIIVISARAQNKETAKALCEAVLNVFQKQVGAEVSIGNMLLVDPVQDFSNITATSTISSVLKGAIGGFALYALYVLYRFFSDRTFQSKEEAQEYLDVPILCVLPDFEKKRLDRRPTDGTAK